MTVDLTRDEIWFLKALRAAGGRSRIVSASVSRNGLAHLVEANYVTEHPQSERKTLYIITARGLAGISGCATGMKAALLHPFGSKADIEEGATDVRFTPKADIRYGNQHVSFVPKADDTVRAYAKLA